MLYQQLIVVHFLAHHDMVGHHGRAIISGFPSLGFVLSEQYDVPLVLFQLALIIRALVLMTVNVTLKYYFCIPISIVPSGENL